MKRLTKDQKRTVDRAVAERALRRVDVRLSLNSRDSQVIHDLLAELESAYADIGRAARLVDGADPEAGLLLADARRRVLGAMRVFRKLDEKTRVALREPEQDRRR